MLFKVDYRIDSSISHTIGEVKHVVIEAKTFNEVVEKFEKSYARQCERNYSHIIFLTIQHLEGYVLWK